MKLHAVIGVEHDGALHDTRQRVTGGLFHRELLKNPPFAEQLAQSVSHEFTRDGLGEQLRGVQDGSLLRAAAWKGAWRHLVSRDRMIARTLGRVFRYLRPSFHPW